MTCRPVANPGHGRDASNIDKDPHYLCVVLEQKLEPEDSGYAKLHAFPTDVQMREWTTVGAWFCDVIAEKRAAPASTEYHIHETQKENSQHTMPIGALPTRQLDVT